MAVYDPRGGKNVHIDKVLTNISLAYPNNGMVGDALFPVVRVRKQSDLFYEFGREGWLPEDDYRAPGTRATEIPGLEVSTNPYFTREYSLQIAVTPEERENADRPLDPDVDGTEHVTGKLLLKREQRQMTIATTAGNFAAGHSTALAGGARWDVAGTSTPISDIKTGLRQVHSQLFMEPNVGVFPYEVMSTLEDHADFIERIKYSQPGIITADIIASVVGLPRIIVPGLGYDSSGNPGQAVTLSYLWPKSVVLAWVAPSPGLKRPSFGYEFNQRYSGGQEQAVRRWHDNDRDADIIRVSRRYDNKLIAVDGTGASIAGYLLETVIS